MDLQGIVLDAIEQRGRLTFAEFMELVLYHPQLGYYNRASLGLGGDFYTAPHLGADFGELLAQQLIELAISLAGPVTLVEMGAGQGILAADILAYLARCYPELYGTLDYVILEKATARRAEQEQRLGPYLSQVRWATWEELGAVTGCFFSNELVDAFPVHRFTVRGGQLLEVYVTAHAGEFQEVVDLPSTPRLLDYFQRVGIDWARLPDGYQSEVNLAALEWLDQVANHLEQGYLLTIDYGYTAQRYYQPSRFTGTLLGYHRHATTTNPYVHLGEQDLTTHVDFTTLERYGAEVGLQPLGFTQQGLFLMALGLGERLAALREDASLSVTQGLARHQALHRWIDPTGLGGFGVLLQGRGIAPGQVFKGWIG